MPQRDRRIAAGWTTLIVLAVVASAAGQQAPGLTRAPADPSYSLIAEFLLELDGTVDEEARIYHSAGRSSVLIRSAQLGAVELQPASRRVFRYSLDDLATQTDGTVLIRTGATPVPSGEFRLVDNLPVLQLGERRLRLVLKPPVLGPFVAPQLVEEIPAYGQRAATYEPQKVYLERLAGLEEEVHIKVIFGSWCSVCSQLLPRILRVESELASVGVTFDYYGINKGYDDPEAKRHNVTSLPTGIFFMRGKEVARAAGNAWTFPAKTIYQYLLANGLLLE